MEIREMITEIKGRLDTRGGLKAVIFVACGGSQAAIYPGKYLLEREANEIAVSIYNSNEFNYVTPKSLDERCIVICCSLKATAETVHAVERARQFGAVTIAMTGSPETGMAKAGEYVVVYSNGDEQIYSQSNQSMALRLGFEILHQFEGYPLYHEAMAAFDQIDTIVAESKQSMLPAAQSFAVEYQNDPLFQVLGAGPLYGTAYSMANCHFMEMHWRNAIMIHSGEYFHGPFEMTSETQPMILLMATGRSRFLDERVLKFLKTYAKRFIVIDAKDTGIEEHIDPRIAEFFNSVVMIPLERFFVEQMSKLCKHSMDDRALYVESRILRRCAKYPTRRGLVLRTGPLLVAIRFLSYSSPLYPQDVGGSSLCHILLRCIRTCRHRHRIPAAARSPSTIGSNGYCIL